jgi:hypothetical protein
MPARAIRIEADLTFASVSADGSAGVRGSVSADGDTIVVTVAGPLTASGLPRRVVRRLADVLARQQLRLVVNSSAGLVAALGDVRAPWWHRLLTGSPHMRLGRLREVRHLLGPRRNGASIAMPPTTPFPLLPTVSSLGPRPVTTTHDPRGGGDPRVVFALSPWPRAGEVARVEYLNRTRTTFGSSRDCDVRVDGLEPLHAVIERTEIDEYVLTHVAAEGTSTVAGVPAQRSLLRTGAGIVLGSTRLTYFRAEYADHGRPFGGRLGGEIDHQRPQPTPRPRTAGAAGKPRTNRDPGQYFD